ncbi:MAG: hypothetical protein ACLU4N_08625 [Butyricimonas faecihominis]
MLKCPTAGRSVDLIFWSASNACGHDRSRERENGDFDFSDKELVLKS